MHTATSRIRADFREPASAQPVRADALYNRNRILDVAHEMLHERGLDVPMAAIARRARFGMATLYRHFPTKESLITEVFIRQFTECVSTIDGGLAAPDSWVGFRTVIEKLCDMQALDSGFIAAFTAMFPDAIDFELIRERGLLGFAELVQRAKDSGELRHDFVEDDLLLVLMAVEGVTAKSRNATLSASRRLVAYMLQTFHIGHTISQLPPPRCTHCRTP